MKISSDENNCKRFCSYHKNISSFSYFLKKYVIGTSLVVQWLRPCAANTGRVGLIPG